MNWPNWFYMWRKFENNTDRLPLSETAKGSKYLRRCWKKAVYWRWDMKQFSLEINRNWFPSSNAELFFIIELGLNQVTFQKRGGPKCWDGRTYWERCVRKHRARQAAERRWPARCCCAQRLTLSIAFLKYTQKLHFYISGGEILGVMWREVKQYENSR